LANHRIYQYTSIGRPLDPSFPSNKAVLILLPAAALLGSVFGWFNGGEGLDILETALRFALVLFGSWALARELAPDDPVVAFISVFAALLAAMLVDTFGLLVVFGTLGLVRIVNRTTGLQATRIDSLAVMVLAIGVMYATDSPFFGAVAGLAFILDGTLREPLRRQWIFGLLCIGASVVYMVDHDFTLSQIKAPATLFEWISLLFLLIFALDTILLKKVRSRGDVGRETLDVSRVRGGMAVGFLAALQGINQPRGVVIMVATIAGLCIGMAFRKGFKAPAG